MVLVGKFGCVCVNLISIPFVGFGSGPEVFGHDGGCTSGRGCLYSVG